MLFGAETDFLKSRIPAFVCPAFQTGAAREAGMIMAIFLSEFLKSQWFKLSETLLSQIKNYYIYYLFILNNYQEN